MSVVDYFVAENRKRMAEDDYVLFGLAVFYHSVGELCERLEKLGVEVRYEWDHESALRGAHPDDDGLHRALATVPGDPGPKVLFAWVPHWIRMFVACITDRADAPFPNKHIKLGPLTRAKVRLLLGSPDAQRALSTAFNAGGRAAARAYIDAL